MSDYSSKKEQAVNRAIELARNPSSYENWAPEWAQEAILFLAAERNRLAAENERLRYQVQEARALLDKVVADEVWFAAHEWQDACDQWLATTNEAQENE